MNYCEIKPCDIANGDGVRVSLFVSGCEKHCKGCFNPSTWDPCAGRLFDNESYAQLCTFLKKPYIKGLTLLGGDPFYPGNRRSISNLLRKLREDKLNGRRHAIIVISENITDVYSLAKEVEAYSGYECRATVLGYIQRGGTPTPEDRLLAARLGKYSVDLLHEGITGVAVGVIKNELHYTPIEEALKMVNSPNVELNKLVQKIS